jgi:hypothetical protein
MSPASETVISEQAVINGRNPNQIERRRIVPTSQNDAGNRITTIWTDREVYVLTGSEL